VAAQRSTCSRLQVGAVLSRSGRILSTGYNGAPSGEPHCDHTFDHNSPCLTSVHAEVNALVFAARHGVSTEGSSFYVTHAPCYACAGLLINAGVDTVYFRHHYRSKAGLDRLVDAEIAVWGGYA
jgi:dCMP deaminase